MRPELRNQNAADLGPAGSEEAALAELAEAFVLRGQRLTEIGEQHSQALATLAERDLDVEQLAEQLQKALATIDERDGQIVGLDSRLAETGEHLGQSLATVEERDEQIRELDRRLNETGQMHAEALAHIDALDARLQRVFDQPVVGKLFRLAWSRANPERKA